METRSFNIRFVAPAFLGNANQGGQWRSPPFKALLRQWWRVAWAEQNNFSKDHKRLNKEEGILFGAASDGSGNRSAVRLRLSSWKMGDSKKYSSLLSVKHPEVDNNNGMIDSGLYLGYGPISGGRYKGNAAIQVNEQAQMRVAFPSIYAPMMDRTFALISAYGTLGGRSRNGWGSFVVDSSTANLDLIKPVLRDWQACLDRDWPHALGQDRKGALIWQTGAHDTWQTLFRDLALIKIGLRTQCFKFDMDKASGDKPSGKGKGIVHGNPQARHWLSNPVTNHAVRSWGGDARLPNSLRFKVRLNAAGQYTGLIFHVPCLPPSQFSPDKSAVISVWEQTYNWLDSQQNLERRPQ